MQDQKKYSRYSNFKSVVKKIVITFVNMNFTKKKLNKVRH